jgi:glycosyltransferase involved in cell wall biosynthesis
MKIGFDVAQTCSERAGCAWYADSLIRAMVKLAPKDDFFLYHQFGDWINPSTQAGTMISAPNVTNTFTDITPHEAARIWQSPPELLIKTGAPDIVHATSFRSPKVLGAKLVFTVYDVSFWAVPQFTTEANRLACQAGNLQALQNADGFLFISQSARDEFERFLPDWLETNKRPWAVTPLAPRQSISPHPALIKTGDRYFLAVGSLEPRKNYEALLDALELYWATTQHKTPLWIAGGPGWRSKKLKDRINHLETSGEVRYLGYIPDSELGNLMADAQALVFPSWYEGFGLPIVEAMACGCPVICSGNTSLREAGGNAAVYVDPNAPLSIATAMHELERAPSIRAELRQKGLAWSKSFTWDQTAEATLRFYNKIMASDYPKPPSPQTARTPHRTKDRPIGSHASNSPGTVTEIK